MEEILEYKKLLRQREKLIQQLNATTDKEELEELEAQVHDIEELLKHLENTSKDIQDYLNKESDGEIVMNQSEIIETTSAENDNEGNTKKSIYGCLIICIFLGFLFYGFKSCLSCNNSSKEEKHNFALIQKETQNENDKRFEKQQEEIRKQQEQMRKQQEEMRRQQEQLSAQDYRLRQQEMEKNQMIFKQQHEELVRNSLSITDGTFFTNIDGYVYFCFNLYNKTNKVIKYFYVWVDILNSVNDPIQRDWCGKYTGPLNGGQQTLVSFQLTNNLLADKYSITSMRVEYMDGTNLIIGSNDISLVYQKAAY